MSGPDYREVWRTLATEAAAGALDLDPSVARDVSLAAAEFAQSLGRLRNDAAAMANIVGIGGLPSAQELAGKFERKAVGAGGLMERYEQIIEVLRLIDETVSYSVDRLVAQDESNGVEVGQTGGGR